MSSSPRSAMLIWLLALLMVACSAPATRPVVAPAATPIVTVPATAPPIVPTMDRAGQPASPIATFDRSQSPLEGEYDLGEFDFTLDLKPDQLAALFVPPASGAIPPAEWWGTWSQSGADVTVVLTQTRAGQRLPLKPSFQLGLVDGRPAITQYGLNDVFYNRADLDLSLGSGQRHPLVRLLNRLLADTPFLDYAYPAQDDDLYTENVRRAVTRFQEALSLSPTGVADPRVWLELQATSRSLPAEPDTPHLSPQDAVINVRTGPGTDFDPLGRLYAGQTLDIMGQAGGGAPDQTWYQVCCIDDQRGWVRADVASIAGPLDRVPTVLPADLPPAPKPVSGGGQTVSGARRGSPLLESLPSVAPDGHPIVYLTFDDGPNTAGPDGGYTQIMLNLLQQYNAHATFFDVGKSVSAWPQIVRAVASGGHYVANHTWDHSSLADMPKEQFVDEADRTRQAILQAAGDLFSLDRDVRYLRPPYGATDANTRQYAAELGYAIVLWDVDPQDWRRPGADVIAQHILSNVFPGAIVLMHDGGGDRAQSVAALEVVLRELSAQGYKFYNIFGN